VFLASLVLLGMPHGALDHLVWFKGSGRRFGIAALLCFCGVYLSIGIVAVGLWWLAPVWCAGGLILLTWFHWGDGDRMHEAAGEGLAGWLFLAWRGSLPMLVPLLLHPHDYAAVLHGAVLVVDPAAPGLGLLDVVVGAEFRSGVAGVLLVLGGVYWWRAGRFQSAARRLALEDLLLIGGFLVLPPLVSIGLYFMLWHSWRHIQLLALALGQPVARVGGGVNWSSFYLRAAPFTLAGISFVVGLALLAGPRLGDVNLLVGVYLIVLWGLTWPHAILCHRMRGLFN
jgi:Brp/Blh family beta-carotene 15,15'-monooxygenase